MTVKPYLTVKNMLIYAAVALFLTITSENAASGMGVGLMLSTLFVGYPFAVGEKSNMDALYITLSVDRKSVVLGRYVYTLTLNLCAVLLATILAAAGTFIAKSFGFSTGVGSPLASIVTLSALFIIIQSIQLPLFFKFGYTKAKFFSIVPYIAMMVGYMAIMMLPNIIEQPFADSGFAKLLTVAFENAAISVVLVAAGMILIVFVSYKLSSVFYRKREF
jgi:hypothetical protein